MVARSNQEVRILTIRAVRRFVTPPPDSDIEFHVAVMPNRNSANRGFGLVRLRFSEQVSLPRNLGWLRRSWQGMIWPIHERSN